MCGGENYNLKIHQRPTLKADKSDVWGREFQGGTFIKVDFVLSSSETDFHKPLPSLTL